MNFCIQLFLGCATSLSLLKYFFQLLLIKKKKLISWGEQLLCAQRPTVVGSIRVFLGHSDVDKWAIPEYTGIEKLLDPLPNLS